MHLARSLRIRAGIPLLIMCAVAAAGVASGCGATPAAQPTTAPAPPTAAAAPPAAAPSPAARPPLASPVASPSPPSASPTQTSTTSGEPAQEYEVKAGDTLLLISQQFYGDVALWRRIYDANREVIGADPDKLALGMKLKIPPKDG